MLSWLCPQPAPFDFHLEFHPRYIGAVDALKTLQWGDLRHKLDEERGKEGAVCVLPRRQRGHWLGSLQVCSFWWHSCCSQLCCCCCSQSLSRVQLFATPWTAACQASLSFTVSWGLLKLTSIGSVTPSHHLILCRTLLLRASIFPSIRVFSNESALRSFGGQSIGASASASVLPMNIQG